MSASRSLKTCNRARLVVRGIGMLKGCGISRSSLDVPALQRLRAHPARTTAARNPGVLGKAPPQLGHQTAGSRKGTLQKLRASRRTFCFCAANLHMFNIGIVTASRCHAPPVRQDSIRSDKIQSFRPLITPASMRTKALG